MNEALAMVFDMMMKAGLVRCDHPPLQPDDDLEDDLDIGVSGLADLVILVEDELAHPVPDEVSFSWLTAGDIASYLKERLHG